MDQEKIIKTLKDRADIDLALQGGLQVLAYTAQQQVVAYFVGFAPFLAWPVIGPVFGFMVGLIVNAAIKYTEMGAFFWYVDQLTTAQVKGYVEARLDYEKVKENGTDEEKKRARKAIVDRARDLIRFDT